MFITLIDQNASLTNVEKLHYLKSNLTGEAEHLLRNFTITDNNYGPAWKTLTEGYENLQVLTRTHIEAILTAQSMQSESVADLKRLVNKVSESIKALENLERPVKYWDDWLVYIISRKLDSTTRKDWEKTLVNANEMPSFEALRSFLLSRIRILESLSSTRVNKNQVVKNNLATTTKSPVNRKIKCVYCQSSNHTVSFCNAFTKLDLVSRQDWVKTQKLCTNCLRSGHFNQDCQSSFRCRTCNNKHHTLLHLKNNSNDNAQTATSLITFRPKISVLLATALVDVQTNEGSYVTYRALIDQGSHASFISTSCLQTLQLSTQKVNMLVRGIGGVTPGRAKSAVTLRCRSLVNKSFQFSCSALVIDKLNISNTTCYNLHEGTHLKNIELADPHYLFNQKIDILFGAEVYALIIQEGIIKGKKGEPIAQLTSLGWIVSGKISNISDSTSNVMNFSTRIEPDLNIQLQQFWEIEEVSVQKKAMSAEDEYCEKQFEKTHSRTNEGRYVVRLPILPEIREKIGLGESLTYAQKRLNCMQRRFYNNEYLKNAYTSFMNEYTALHHMSRINQHDLHLSKADICYLPHHCVLKDTSPSTKLRVVFDGASKTSNGVSLNERLLSGPKLQLDITEIVTRWRLHRFVFTTDVEKMFR